MGRTDAYRLLRRSSATAVLALVAAAGIAPARTVDRVSAARAGHWVGHTTASNFEPSPVAFTVTSSRRVAKFSFTYHFSATSPMPPYSCPVSGKGVQGASLPIVGGSFKRSSTSFYFRGTFDSPTHAHGVVGVQGIPTGCQNPSTTSSGPQPWTATWRRR